MSTRLDWRERSSSAKKELKEDGEISRISFEAARATLDRLTSLDRKVIGYKTRTVSEPIYEDELVKNVTMEICDEAINTNPNNIYIPIKVCLEGYNKYELCAYIDSGCSVRFGKRSLFLEFLKKRAKNALQVRIADNSIMSHNEVIEVLSIELGGVQCIISVLWATDQSSHDMIIGNNF